MGCTSLKQAKECLADSAGLQIAASSMLAAYGHSKTLEVDNHWGLLPKNYKSS